MTDILKPYEVFEKKCFSLRELAKLINEHLRSLESENPATENKDLFFELVAFKLHEKSDLWGKYYGPEFRGTNEDGTHLDVPPIDAINIESIKYWESRIDEVENPILRARYSGIVWEFKHEISGERLDICECI